MTTSLRLHRVSPVLIGLWRFHHASWKDNKWCCTWRYRGSYYDTFPKDTADKALDAVYKNWQKAKGRKRKMPL